MMDADYSLIEIALSSMTVDDLDDAHDDDYLIVMMQPLMLMESLFGPVDAYDDDNYEDP